MEVLSERCHVSLVSVLTAVIQKEDGRSFCKLSLWPVNLQMLAKDRVPFGYLQRHPAS